MTSVFDIKSMMKVIATQHPNLKAECFYMDDAFVRPICLVGHALHQLGVKVPRDGNMERFRTLIQDGMIDLDIDVQDSEQYEAMMWIDRAQRAQDRGRSWGEALEMTHEAYGP